MKTIKKTVKTEIQVCENCEAEGAIELHCHECGQEICQRCAVRIKILKPSDRPKQDVLYYCPGCWATAEVKLFGPPQRPSASGVPIKETTSTSAPPTPKEKSPSPKSTPKKSKKKKGK